jgi:hypothetical protein
MKYLKKWNDFERLDESWIHNILTAISLIGGVALPTITKASTENLDKIEKSINVDKKFFSACLQFCNELPTKSIEQKSALIEAKLYFKSLRDGEKPDKLSKVAKVIVKSIEITITSMDKDKFNALSDMGKTSKVSGEVVGL